MLIVTFLLVSIFSESQAWYDAGSLSTYHPAHIWCVDVRSSGMDCWLYGSPRGVCHGVSVLPYGKHITN